MDQIYKQLIKGIQKFFKKSGQSRVVLGVSGGIDSALTLKLLADAIGANKVTGISMPEYGITNPLNTQHAKLLIEALGATHFNQPINSYLVAYTQLPWRQSDNANINVKARVRATILYNYANTAQALVAGTSNRSELLLGYGTKFGDLACDFFPIGDLYKEEVITLADYLELPREIIEKKPSAELYKGQTDEAELGASYSELDPILARYDASDDSLADKLIEKGMSPTLIHNVLNRIEANKHKSKTPVIIKVK